MAIAAPIQNQKAKGQPASRRYQRFRDDHNRRWGSVVENKTGDPCGIIEPIGWRAPWMPDPKYITVAKDEEGHIEVGRLHINYKQMLRDARQERKDRQERLEFYAQAMYGERSGEMIDKPPAQLTRLLKHKPTDPEVIVAAQKGDRWLLGLEQGDCPEYLRPYFAKKLLAEELGDDEIELDPEFVEKMEAAFEAAKIKPKEAPASYQRVAEQAREDSEHEAEEAATKTARRARKDAD